MKTLIIDDYTIKIGENKHENWSLIENRNPRHLFFHLTSFPSCYVILECDNKVEKYIKERCARICLEHTKYRRLKNVKVDCCFCGNVVRGEEIGEVEYKSNRKVEVIKV